MAINAGLPIVKSVTKNLAYLCCGENAGYKKLEKAKEINAILLTRKEFINFLETGEIST